MRIALVIALVAAVGAASGPAESTHPSTAPDVAPCDFQPPPGDHPWLCGTVPVPVDRADPSAGTLDIHYEVLPRRDKATPPGIPLFVSPGGPGGDGWDNYVLYQMQSQIHQHHDIVTLDPRGAGLSEWINCPTLQAGPLSHSDYLAAVTACAEQLGTASSRYGAGDRAMDVEALRAALGYDQIDFYGGSYGGVDGQAYAARFPDRLHALVLDSTFPVNDPGHIAWSGGSYAAAALVHIKALQCKRDPSCSSLTSDPETTIRDAIAHVRDHPIDGTSSGAGGRPIHLDDLAVASVVAGAEPYFVVGAADALLKGNAQLMIDLAANNPQFSPFDDSDSVIPLSLGANVAGGCNDQDTPWDRADTLATRKAAYNAYLAGLPPDTFAPFSVSGWSQFTMMDQCLAWPAPTNFTPVVPAGTVMPSVPVLILSGDEDNGVPLGLSRALLDEFPQASFVQVEGAGHLTMSMDGSCVPSIVGGFLATGVVPDTTCAGTPG